VQLPRQVCFSCPERLCRRSASPIYQGPTGRQKHRPEHYCNQAPRPQYPADSTARNFGQEPCGQSGAWICSTKHCDFANGKGECTTCGTYCSRFRWTCKHRDLANRFDEFPTLGAFSSQFGCTCKHGRFVDARTKCPSHGAYRSKFWWTSYFTEISGECTTFRTFGPEFCRTAKHRARACSSLSVAQGGKTLAYRRPHFVGSWSTGNPERTNGDWWIPWPARWCCSCCSIHSRPTPRVVWCTPAVQIQADVPERWKAGRGPKHPDKQARKGQRKLLVQQLVVVSTWKPSGGGPEFYCCRICWCGCSQHRPSFLGLLAILYLAHFMGRSTPWPVSPILFSSAYAIQERNGTGLRLPALGIV
jgi:hypothetical protein